jgi:hypothetical protein
MPLLSYAFEGQLMPKSEVLFVTPELQRVLDNLPDSDPRSKLEPFRPFILRWRRRGRSYRAIRQILHDECHVHASLSTLFNFVERCSRPRTVQPEPEIELATMPPPKLSGETAPANTRKPHLTHEERVAQADAIRAALAKSVSPVGRWSLSKAKCATANTSVKSRA